MVQVLVLTVLLAGHQMSLTDTFHRLLVLFFLASPSLGTLYTDFSQLKRTTYDYIVVGGKYPNPYL